MNFANTIRTLRADHSASQSDIAKHIGIARATYVGLESGRRDPNLSEIKAIAEYYQISPQDLINGKTNFKTTIDNDMISDSFETAKIVVPTKPNSEKLKEVLLYVTNKVGAKPNVGETVLYKLLYFIDFDYFEKHEHSITNMTYVRNHFGPTPSASFLKVVEEMEQNSQLERVKVKFFANTQTKYLPAVKPQLDFLTANELEHINWVLDRLSDKNAKELSELSHKDMPWIAAKPGEKINYNQVFYRTDVTSVTESDDEL